MLLLLARFLPCLPSARTAFAWEKSHSNRAVVFTWISFTHYRSANSSGSIKLVLFLVPHSQNRRALHAAGQQREIFPYGSWPRADSSDQQRRVPQRIRRDRQPRWSRGDDEAAEDATPRLQWASHSRIAPESVALVAGWVRPRLSRERTTQDMLLPLHPRVLHRAWRVSASLRNRLKRSSLSWRSTLRNNSSLRDKEPTQNWWIRWYEICIYILIAPYETH